MWSLEGGAIPSGWASQLKYEEQVIFGLGLEEGQGFLRGSTGWEVLQLGKSSQSPGRTERLSTSEVASPWTPDQMGLINSVEEFVL